MTPRACVAVLSLLCHVDEGLQACGTHAPISRHSLSAAALSGSSPALLAEITNHIPRALW
jgi:hypothetical protein